MNKLIAENKHIPIFALVVLAALFILLHVLMLGRYPAAGGDEVSFSATAYTFLRTGNFARLINPGASGYQIRDYYPPVVTLLMSVAYLVLGFGVWQTKFVTLAAGIASTILLFLLVRRLTNNVRAALAAIFVFALNSETFNSWQSGRAESVFVLLLVLVLFLAYSVASEKYQSLRWIWFVIGLTSGVMAITYYPFALPGCLIVALVLWDRVWNRAELTNRQRMGLLVTTCLGIGLVLLVFAIHVLVRPDLFSAQILGQLNSYTNVEHGLAGFLLTARGEPARYWMYAFNRLSLSDLLLALFVLIAGLPNLFNRASPPRVFWLAMVVWIVTFTFYGQKTTIYLADMAPFVALSVALTMDQFEKRGRWTLSAGLLVLLVGLTLVAGVLRSALVGYTVAYQWAGRDYLTFSREVREAVPEYASVIGPQFAWYTLATYADSIRLYGQGGIGTATLGDATLNQPDSLNEFDYVLLDEHVVKEGRLDGFISTVRSHFTLTKVVRMPFRPLPWAASSPYDIDVYIRTMTTR